jgi:Xaa-Pro aminopeptidase
MKRQKTLKASAPKLARSFFAGRRKEFFNRLPENSIAIIVSNPEMTRSNDTAYPYRQSSDVLYLSGFPEAGAVLVFKKTKNRNRFIMFVRPSDPERETWDGRRAGIDGAKTLYGCVEAHSIDDFTKVMPDLLAGADEIFYKLDRNPHVDAEFKPLWKDQQPTLRNPEDILHVMRHIKEPVELDQMRHVAEISAQAHCQAMRKVRPGMHEYEIQAIIESFGAANGAPEQAYNTIAAGGNNGVILHYNTNAEELVDGDLLLVDAGCEFRGYAADITRTYPVNGKFSDAQREVYEVVLAAQLAAIRAARPGATINIVHAAAENVLRRGMVKLGILPAKMGAKSNHDRIVAKAEKRGTEKLLAHTHRWFMHGTSHWLGLDVHDVCGLEKKAGKALPLAPGMVITVEPGLYLPKDDKLVPKRYRGIGIRIEDDVVITADGCEVITSSVPKTVEDIENLMAETR